jgi:hypothetical protein
LVPHIKGRTEEHRLRMFEDRKLRRMFGPKRDEVTEHCKLHIMRSFTKYY